MVKALLFLAVFCAAQTPDDRARWARLSTAEKQQLRQTYDRWMALPDREKDELRQRFEQFQNLPPEERARAETNFRRFWGLPEGLQNRIRDRFRQFWRLPPEVRFQRLNVLREQRRIELQKDQRKTKRHHARQ